MANKTIGSLPYSIGLRKTNPSDKSSEMKAYPVGVETTFTGHFFAFLHLQ